MLVTEVHVKYQEVVPSIPLLHHFFLHCQQGNYIFLKRLLSKIVISGMISLHWHQCAHFITSSRTWDLLDPSESSHPHAHKGWNRCLRQYTYPWGSDFLCWCQTSEPTHLWNLARLDQGSALTVSCARPQTPTSGSSCTGQVSYPYGPVHHIPGKTVWEVGCKRRKKRIQPTEMAPLLLFIYQNFMQALSKACLRYWF